MALFKGWLYFYLWYSSIFAGYVLLFCPLFPVLLISNKLYRYISDVLFTYWQFYPTALTQFLFGCNIQVTGDVIRTGEMSLLLMNHRTRTDWNFIWPVVYHCVEEKGKLAHSTKFILKDPIKHIPGPGWVMQLACFVYIKRCWQLDKLIFDKYVNYVSRIRYNHSLLIFPEGTDLTEQTKKSSDRYAEKNNLPLYDYVLHPKTTGFAYLAHQLLAENSLDAVYDCTLAYPDVIPKNEKFLLEGNFPKEVKVHLVRYPKSILPTSEEDLKEFLEKRWLDKEKTLKEFKATGNFLHGKILKCDKIWELHIAFIFWTILPFISIYFFFTVAWFRNIALVHTLFLLTLNFFFEGFQNFEINLQNFKDNVSVKVRNVIPNNQ
ncbi:unnamed protein product [Psylliodes chrysocephalus]|uniref:Phospholipid/glycerol acyltransferase domain-containing protein n=1 Tax=Psylliodes chrysocephalus TaxID=3402493 RepID=A0A9P0D192_9CUCU|nr:unnamed protein product [Psylliodes chrysocephala]